MKWNIMLSRKNDVLMIQEDLQDICISLAEKQGAEWCVWYTIFREKKRRQVRIYIFLFVSLYK